VVKKPTHIGVLSQEERNELGEAMRIGMEKQSVEVWNSALAAVVTELQAQARDSELVLASSVVAMVNSLRKEEDG
jgi:anti-sigma-K factor RskA